MRDTYSPNDWYWLSDDGRVFSSARGIVTDEEDEGYKLFVSGGRATPWPRDDSDQQTDFALDQVLNVVGLSGPGGATTPAAVSSAQAKIQLLRTPGSTEDKTLLDDVTSAVHATGGEAAIWFAEARTWERTNPYVASLSASLKLKSEQVDALFVAASKIAA